MQKFIAITLQSLLLATLLAPSASADKAPKNSAFFDPMQAGPFPVGVMTTAFVDQSRIDNLTKEPRTLVTEIWYPATDEARNKPKNKYSDFIPTTVTPEIEAQLKSAYRLPLAMLDKVYSNEAVRNASVRQGRFPLVVFSHGNGGNRHQNTFWCDYLASHGYIVVSADHTGNARMTIINGKVIPMQGSERAQSAQDRPKDVSFLLDKMIEWDKGVDKRFAGKIDTNRVAISGMSFGSFTSHWASDADPRFKAVVAMSGAPATHTNLTIPTLRMLGSEDRTLGIAGNALIRHNHQIHKGPAFLLELKNGGHFSFTDMFKITSQFGDGIGKGKRRDSNEEIEFTPMETTYKIINSYSIAFLGYYLKGQKEYLPFLKDNHWKDELIWEVKGIELR
jgi:predicted dienelactone hydrolase